MQSKVRPSNQLLLSFPSFPVGLSVAGPSVVYYLNSQSEGKSDKYSKSLRFPVGVVPVVDVVVLLRSGDGDFILASGAALRLTTVAQ